MGVLGRVGENIGGRIWVRVGTEESMQDLALHHREYTFVATTFLKCLKIETLGTPPALNLVHSKFVNSCTSVTYPQNLYDAVTSCLKIDLSLYCRVDITA